MSSSTQIEVHPFCAIFPEMLPFEYAGFVEDVRVHGLLDPRLYTYQGKMLEGRHRLRAAQDLGITCYELVEFQGDEKAALAFCLSRNLKRRHLSAGQQLATTEAAATLPPHRPEGSTPRGVLLSQPEAARLSGFGVRSIQRMRVVRTQGAPELYAAVKQDLVAPKTAALLTQLPREQQQEIATKLFALAERPNANAYTADDAKRAACALAHQVLRQARHEHIIDATVAEQGKDFPPFVLIYADPPWEYESAGREAVGGSISDHYATLALPRICSFLDDKGIRVHSDAVLFLWVTVPMLPEGLEVMRAWGFEYKTTFVWDKQRALQGSYCLIQTEFLLLGIRGAMPPPVLANASNLLSVKRGAHSVKPEEARALIESMYGEQNKIELFARRQSPGWVSVIDGRIGAARRGEAPALGEN